MADTGGEVVVLADGDEEDGDEEVEEERSVFDSNDMINRK